MSPTPPTSSSPSSRSPGARAAPTRSPTCARTSAATGPTSSTRAPGCPRCADALANLRTDLGCHWTDLQHARAPAPSPQRRAALAIVEAFQRGDPRLAAPYFTSRHVTTHVVCGGCDGSDGDAGDDVRQRAGADALAALFAGDAVSTGARIWCDDQCCSRELGYESDTGRYLTSICFVPGTTIVREVWLLAG